MLLKRAVRSWLVATIVATHLPSGTRYVAAANDEGRFVINGMRTGGPYKVEIFFIGMATLEINDVYLSLGEAYEINAEMESSNELGCCDYRCGERIQLGKDRCGFFIQS